MLKESIVEMKSMMIVDSKKGLVAENNGKGFDGRCGRDEKCSDVSWKVVGKKKVQFFMESGWKDRSSVSWKVVGKIVVFHGRWLEKEKTEFCGRY